jgi:hypothetical protein
LLELLKQILFVQGLLFFLVSLRTLHPSGLNPISISGRIRADFIKTANELPYSARSSKHQLLLHP